METTEVPVHNHPLISFTSFALKSCLGCRSSRDDYIYGGYRCNELGCDTAVFHKECARPLQEINHSSHPDHSLKLIILDLQPSTCSFCGKEFKVGYCCSICDFKLDFVCAMRPPNPLYILEKPKVHEHPLKLLHKSDFYSSMNKCKLCDISLLGCKLYYSCHMCKLVFHVDCVKFFTESYHTSHPKHPLKFLTKAIQYADKECLLCGIEFDGQLQHCNVCNFSICSGCMKNPPPIVVASPTTHEHQLHLIPRRIDFTCNACGTQGDRSPYFCLLCNFMIHRECIDLPRVININRHDHRISYTRRLGHGDWKCGVCRKDVDGFYGAYSCNKCPTYAVHSRCATRKDIWDMVELEGTPEEPEEAGPFEVIDENTIKHFSHDHNLRINKDGRSLHESTLCEACVFQICSESFYSCDQCDFTLHEKCANLPRNRRHVCHNQRFKLQTYSLHEALRCILCHRAFTGFRYISDSHMILDIQCGSISEPFLHNSHPHPLYYSTDNCKRCSGCGRGGNFSCDECDFSLDYKCAILPQKVTSYRYDDHPLFLSYGERIVDGEYWCEACETKVNPKKWFYSCNDCGITLHISCLVGDLAYKMPGSVLCWGEEVVPNTSICRALCSVCNSRCKLPFILQVYKAGVFLYFCSFICRYKEKL